jgi:hypothetical protein
MIEGVYQFMLSAWTNKNEYSQDIVNVFVYSTAYQASKEKDENLNTSNAILLLKKKRRTCTIDYLFFKKKFLFKNLKKI